MANVKLELLCDFPDVVEYVRREMPDEIRAAAVTLAQERGIKPDEGRELLEMWGIHPSSSSWMVDELAEISELPPAAALAYVVCALCALAAIPGALRTPKRVLWKMIGYALEKSTDDEEE